MCIFCEICKGNIPSYKIYEDDLCIAILDISQANIGHTLVMPKKHFDNVLDIDCDTLKHLFCVSKKVAKVLCEKLNVKDFNILNNCGKNAGQTVDHFHIHVIPRYENDDMVMEFSSHKLSDTEFENLANKLHF